MEVDTGFVLDVTAAPLTTCALSVVVLLVLLLASSPAPSFAALPHTATSTTTSEDTFMKT